MDAKQLRSIIKEELEPIKETQKEHTNRLYRLENKVDALSGDVEQLHMDVKGIRDKEGMAHSRNKREIDEIKTHLNMPLMSDIPEV